jgi:DNA adenine methylase
MLYPSVIPFTTRPLNSTEKKAVIRPFLRWVGGKQRLLPSLLERIPKNFNGTYYEPFLGGGSMFLANGFKNAHLSDLNPHLINAYKMVRDKHEEIHLLLTKHQLQIELRERAYYYEQRLLFNEIGDCKSPEQAARFIFLIHSNFNGMFRVNLKNQYNVPFGQPKPSIPNLERLAELSQLLKRTKVNLDIHGYDSILHQVKAGDFVYLDPPYPILSRTAKFTSYTIERFSEEEQRKLAHFATQLHHKGANVMISIAGVDLVHKLYPKRYWRYFTTELQRNVSAKRPAIMATELILTNYKP